MTREIVLYVSTGYGYVRERNYSAEELLARLDNSARVFELDVVGRFHDHMHWKNRHNPELDRENLKAALQLASDRGAGLMVGDIKRLGPDKPEIDKWLHTAREMGVVIWIESGQVYDALTVAKFLGEEAREIE